MGPTNLWIARAYVFNNLKDIKSHNENLKDGKIEVFCCENLQARASTEGYLAVAASTPTSSSLLVIDMLTLTLTIKLYLGCLKKFIPHKLVLICYILFFTLSNHYTA